MELVRRIMTIPKIWDVATEDGQDYKYWQPADNDKRNWVIATDDIGLVGVIYIHSDNCYTAKLHPYVIPKRKGKGGYMIKAFFSWFLRHWPWCVKLVASIPVCYPRVCQLAQRLGFSQEGINTASYKKNGELHDQLFLGISSEKMREVILWV